MRVVVRRVTVPKMPGRILEKWNRHFPLDEVSFDRREIFFEQEEKQSERIDSILDPFATVRFNFPRISTVVCLVGIIGKIRRFAERTLFMDNSREPAGSNASTLYICTSMFRAEGAKRKCVYL